MRHILFLCLMFFCIACEENESVDPTLMPDATAIGANTFGCLVDGWVYVSGRWGLPAAEYTQLEDSTGMQISAQVGFGSYLRFTIANPKQGETLPYADVSFDNQRVGNGKVHISRMSDGIFSGTFEGDRITKGCFDLKYKE
ncbi:MAG: hypothetical protein LUH63_14185 [Parabacteroides sp.]|nr:hypothetical protein [Parabacteroides sp.]